MITSTMITWYNYFHLVTILLINTYMYMYWIQNWQKVEIKYYII